MTLKGDPGGCRHTHPSALDVLRLVFKGNLVFLTSIFHSSNFKALWVYILIHSVSHLLNINWVSTEGKSYASDVQWMVIFLSFGEGIITCLGVGRHLFRDYKKCLCPAKTLPAEGALWCLSHWIVSNPLDYSPPNSSVHGIFQARTLGSGLLFPSLGDLPDPRIEPVSCVFCIAGRFFTHWAIGNCFLKGTPHQGTVSY